MAKTLGGYNKMLMQPDLEEDENGNLHYIQKTQADYAITGIIISHSESCSLCGHYKLEDSECYHCTKTQE